MKKILTEGFFYSIICLVFSRTQRNARVAQLVECDLAKVEAAGSSPVSRFSFFLKGSIPDSLYPVCFLFYPGNLVCPDVL